MSLNVAVTGAAGRIGHALVERLAGQDHTLRLIDLAGRGLRELASLGAVVEYDLLKPPPPDLFGDVAVVVHLAGEPDPTASWERLHAANIEASYNVAAAALTSGCRRLIAASSVHAVSAARERPVSPEAAVAPGDLYGVTKCFVEALCLWFARQPGRSAAAVRIGAFQRPDGSELSPGQRDVFIADSDLISLLERAIVADYEFAILHGAAPGPGSLLDTRATEQLLGWRAQHHAPSAG